MFYFIRCPPSERFHFLAFAIFSRLASDDPIDQRSLRLDELFHSFLYLYDHHFFNWFFDIDCLNASLGTNFLGGFEIWEKVTGFDDDLLVIFQEIYLTV